MVKVVAPNYFKEECLEKVLALFEEMVTETRKEEGCITYELFQDDKDPTHLVFIEEWTSQEALDKHFQTPHFTRIVPETATMKVKEEAVCTYKKVY